MSRVRDLLRRTACFQALALMLVAGCIFSPDTKEIQEQPLPPFEKPEDVINALSRAYQTQNYELFASLLANDPDQNAAYLFYLSEPTQTGETQWGYEEEVKIHRRMFRPEDPTPGEDPVSADLWLSSVAIHLTPTRNFQERFDLYSADSTGTDGKLDPRIWKATDAQYSTDVLFDTQSTTDYQVTGDANFVVIENKTKHVGDPGKFLLYIWEDLQGAPKPLAAKRPAA